MNFLKNQQGKIIDHILPVLVWIAVLAAIAYIVNSKGQKFETIGIVNREERVCFDRHHYYTSRIAHYWGAGEGSTIRPGMVCQSAMFFAANENFIR